MGLFSKIFGSRPSLADFKAKGAIVIDVRTPEEFKSGHVKGAKNIPLQQINTRTEEILRMKKPVILCCASGMRSGQATRILKAAGVDCMNGGSWTGVSRAF